MNTIEQDWADSHRNKIRENLRECSTELLNWYATGILKDGIVREIAKDISEDIGETFSNRVRIVESMVRDVAFQFVLDKTE